MSFQMSVMQDMSAPAEEKRAPPRSLGLLCAAALAREYKAWWREREDSVAPLLDILTAGARVRTAPPTARAGCRPVR